MRFKTCVIDFAVAKKIMTFFDFQQIFAHRQLGAISTQAHKLSQPAITADKLLAHNMNEVVTGNNSTVIIDDKDTISKTKNVEKTVNIEKVVNVTKSDNSQIESDIQVIQSDISKLITKQDKHTVALNKVDKKINKLITKLKAWAVTDVQKEESNESV